MEAVRDFIRDFTACGDEAQGTDRGAAPVGQSGMDAALAALRAVGSTAVEDAGSWGFRAASDFAGQVEEVSRAVEYLQLVAAAAVDRTRKQSAAAGAGAAAGAVTAWTTGWRESPAGWQTGAPGAAEPAGASVAADPAGTSLSVGSPPARLLRRRPPDAPERREPAVPESVLDDGYRNTVEFLRARLRIGAAEARRRLGLADTLLPRQGLAGRPMPPVHPELAAAVAAGEVASRAATVITLALDRVRHTCLPEAAAAMEHALTRTAAENDADFLARVSRSWAEALDQDGAEPSEELLRQLQGAFLRKPRHGLQHLEIFATTDQFEHLITVMNTATNPRTGPDTGEGTATGHTAQAGPGDGSAAADEPGPADEPATAEEDAALPSLDLRSRPQKLLDGLVGACKAPSPPEGCPPPAGSGPRSWPPSTTGTCSPGSGRLPPKQAPLPTPHSTAPEPGTAPGRCCSPAPSPPAPSAKSPATPTSSPSSSAARARSWTSAGPPGSSRPTSARPSPPGTGAAPSRNAPSRRPGARPTTSPTGPAAEPPEPSNGTLLCSHHHHVIHKEHWTIQMQHRDPLVHPATPPRPRPDTPTEHTTSAWSDPVAAA